METTNANNGLSISEKMELLDTLTITELQALSKELIKNGMLINAKLQNFRISPDEMRTAQEQNIENYDNYIMVAEKIDSINNDIIKQLTANVSDTVKSHIKAMLETGYNVSIQFKVIDGTLNILPVIQEKNTIIPSDKARAKKPSLLKYVLNGIESEMTGSNCYDKLCMKLLNDADYMALNRRFSPLTNNAIKELWQTNGVTSAVVIFSDNSEQTII